MSSLNDLQIARKAAEAGALVIRERFGASQTARIKNNSQTLVTDTDVAAETAILELLKNHSDYTILSEESGLSEKKHGPKWIVDPLDGTSNFARQLPLFAVSVALVHNAEILAGVIVDPMHSKEFYACKGGGAFFNNSLLVPAKLQNPTPVLFINHGHHAEDKSRFTRATAILSPDYSLRKLGTTALELCYVAAGLFDGFICSGDEIWDFAAGVLIASEAGMIFTDWRGKAWDGKSNFVLVSRPEIHEEIIKKISPLQ
jgi:myo-inositol-1(or 4)-monophosphatase